jgi:hypothetical protein
MVELGETYYNTKANFIALESLLQKLPSLDAPVKPSPKRPKPGRARQLDDEDEQRCQDQLTFVVVVLV